MDEDNSFVLKASDKEQMKSELPLNKAKTTQLDNFKGIRTGHNEYYDKVSDIHPDSEQLSQIAKAEYVYNKDDKSELKASKKFTMSGMYEVDLELPRDSFVD